MKHGQRGVALISVLLVMATVVTLLTWVLSRHWLEIRRSSNLLESRQAHYYALAAETFAQQVLAADLRHNQIDHRGEAWAELMEPLVIEEGALWLLIDDLQGRFNINNLVDSSGQVRPLEAQRFRRLLAALSLPERHAAELEDWLGHLARTPAHMTGKDRDTESSSDGWITAVAELRQLESMTAEDFRRLAPHISALPEGTPINVNTASAAVLQSLSPALTATGARRLVTHQQAGGWSSVAAFAADARLSVPEETISVASRYFEVRVEARYGRQRAMLTSMIERRQGRHTAELQVLGRQHLLETGLRENRS